MLACMFESVVNIVILLSDELCFPRFLSGQFAGTKCATNLPVFTRPTPEKKIHHQHNISTTIIYYNIIITCFVFVVDEN